MSEAIKRSWVRWVFGVIICSNGLSYGINRYVLVPIQDQVIDWYSISAVEYNLLMTLYSWPNVLFSMICGILIDKCGVRLILLMSWIITIIGLSIISYSSSIKYYLLLCTGRVIVGIGNEGISMTAKLYAIKFFNQNEFGILFAIYLAFISFGGAANTFISYRLYVAFNIVYSMSFPLIISPFICIPLFILMFCEKIYCKQFGETKQLIETNTKKNPSTATAAAAATASDKFRFSDIKHFSKHFWILLAAFVIFCGAVQSGLNIGISYIHHMFEFSYDFATTIAVFGTICQTFAYLIAGKITTNFGIKCELLLISCFCGFCGGYIYGWINDNEFWAFFGALLNAIAIGFSYPVVWAAIPTLVIDKVKGTAFGFATSIRFGTIAICYIFVGILTQKEDGKYKYIFVQYFIMWLVVASTIIYGILYYLDITENNEILRKVNIEKKQLPQKQDDALLSMGYISVVKDDEPFQQ